MFMATAIGFVLFVTGLGNRLPTVVTGALDGVAALNGPLAMIVLGVYLAQDKPSPCFAKRELSFENGSLDRI